MINVIFFNFCTFICLYHYFWNRKLLTSTPLTIFCRYKPLLNMKTFNLYLKSFSTSLYISIFMQKVPTCNGFTWQAFKQHFWKGNDGTFCSQVTFMAKSHVFLKIFDMTKFESKHVLYQNFIFFNKPAFEEAKNMYIKLN